jgi:glycosyltransferase involved in cell wall biosynthesis
MLIKYKITILKLRLECILIFPFLKIGNIIARSIPLKEEYDIFFFFPFYHTGGVEKYNASIAKGIPPSMKAIIFFTRKSIDDNFLSAFKSSGHRIINISRFTDNKWIYWCNLIFRGIISFYINNQKEKKPVVFNGQSNFGYKISPWIRKDIRQIECIHTFSTFSKIRMPFIEFYQFVFSPSFKTINDHKDYYKKTGAPEVEFNKFILLITGIETSEILHPKEKNKPLKVLFVGRGSTEKRIELAAMIAKKVKSQQPDISFEFIGNVEKYIPHDLSKFCIVHGNIQNKETIEYHYQKNNVLLITSSFEGFPLVVMEAMNNGLAIISTEVGDVPLHVKNDINGYIAKSSLSSEEITDYMSNRIIQLHSNRNLLHAMSINNHSYAVKNFSVKDLGNKLLPYIKYTTFE